MTASTWQDDIELPPATTWLLEASAGTGKTFQIAGLFARLVAEYGLPVERILAITFTNAATAELRDRVRQRLRDGLALLREGAPKTDDPVFQHLLRLENRDLMEKRLELAIRGFDLAPISTIHGFSQRMLKELAFDSGQDSELELLSDVSEVIDQIVDDTLATIYARASAAEIPLLATAGVTRDFLLRAARAMSGPTEPAVVPAQSGAVEAELAKAAAWAASATSLRARWNSDEGARALAQAVDDASAKRLNVQVGYLESSLGKAIEWLAEPVPGERAEAWLRRLSADGLRNAWKGAPGDLASRPWWPLLLELERLCEEHERLFDDFAPLAAFAHSVRKKVEAELARRRALTYDGMLSRLAERVAEQGGEKSELAARIRERFDAAFVDEFQDTDDAQWRVIEAAFHRHRRLFLLGDPKQAIYAFRGADVHVYLEAARVVDESHRRTMVQNWRSDPQSVRAMNALWRAGSAAFDQDAIDYVRVWPMKPARLEPCKSGLEIRWLDARVVGGTAGQAISKKIEGGVALHAAREAVAWLTGQRAKIRAGDAADGPRDLEPADLAVLVNSHHEAELVRLALRRVGVPSVAASKESVFDTPVAGWLASWLDAVGGAGRDREARTAVVTPLFGWTGDELAWALAVANQGDVSGAPGTGPTAAQATTAAYPTNATKAKPRDWNEWTERLRAAAERWPKVGFARTFDREAVECGTLALVLAMPDGERHATDLRHLFELLHVEERTRRAGPSALADWLRAQVGVGSEETGQRLESDAQAVTIETVHASKGLEYPIVLLPFGWSARTDKDDGKPLVVRGESRPELHVGIVGTEARDAAHVRYCAEQRREGLRKLYVGLTRARHHTVAWFGPVGREGGNTSATPLGRLLMRDPKKTGFDDDAMPAFDSEGADAWALAKERLEALAEGSEGTISWSAETPELAEGAAAFWTAPARAAAELRRAVWSADRPSLSGPWLVTSYSNLAAGSAAPDRDDKLSNEALPSADDAGATNTASGGSTGFVGTRKRVVESVSLTKPPLATFSGPPRLSGGRGKGYGSWVHGVLEQLDFANGRAKDGRPIEELVSQAGARYGFGGDSVSMRDLAKELHRQLPTLLHTPLDSARADDAVRGLPPQFSLGALTAADRLDELPFDLRLGEGTAWRRAPGSEVESGELATRPGCIDPKKVYAAILDASEATVAGAQRSSGVTSWLTHLRERREAGHALIGSIAGILTGSIDLVFRARHEGATRYFIADYKTNRIGTSEPGHYAGPWLDWEMAKTGYPLQALLYTLALHRHLGTRLGKRYDYDTHVGGYVYLFLRGMAGRDTPRDPETGRCLGVFGDRWSKDVVLALDEALSPAGEVTK